MKKARDLFEGPAAPTIEPPQTKPSPVREPGPAPSRPKPKHHPDNPFRRRHPTDVPMPRPKACDSKYEARAAMVVKRMLVD